MSAITKILLIAFFLSTNVVFAQTTKSKRANRTKIQKQQSRAKAIQKRRQRLLAPYYSIGARVHLGQESVAAQRGAASENIPAQFSGIGAAAIYRKPMGHIRWVQNHSLEAYFGTMAAKGNAAIQDEFRNQPWYSFSFNPGITYRTTSITELGISLPLTYRYVSWELNDPTLELNKSSTFSYGLTLSYGANFGRRNTLIFALSSQFGWDSTVWTLGWNHRL